MYVSTVYVSTVYGSTVYGSTSNHQTIMFRSGKTSVISGFRGRTSLDSLTVWGLSPGETLTVKNQRHRTVPQQEHRKMVLNKAPLFLLHKVK